MTRGWVAFLFVCRFLMDSGVVDATPALATEPIGQPAIMLVAFGSTVPEARQTFERIGADVVQAFPSQRVVWAYTAELVREKLKEQGVQLSSPQEALDALAREGFREVVLQSMHIMPGEEYQALFALNPQGMKLQVGAPLLSSERDLDEVAEILGGLYRADRPNVVAAHGNHKRPQLNEPLLRMAERVENRHTNVVLATIDGPPGTRSFERIKGAVQAAGGVHFVPLMLISGIHVRDDLMGVGQESWKELLGAREASVSEPLGELPGVRKIIVRHIREAHPIGHRTEALMSAGASAGVSSFARWKMRMSFWPRKVVSLVELALIIIAGVFLGQLLEEFNVIRFLSVLVRPITALGVLPRETAAPFIFSFQSGAVANSMLVNLRDNGILDARGLYVSVFVVSSFSLFAHLPTYIIPLGMAFGWVATGALFSVRLIAILTQVVVVLLVGRLLTRGGRAAAGSASSGAAVTGEPAGFERKGGVAGLAARVTRRSWRTVRRLLIYLVPTFFLTAYLEQSGFFIWLTAQAPWLFRVGGLPAESAVIIGAQAVNLYNGAIMAASFTDSGAITVRQAVLILLTGTLLTAPIRTLKHSMSTYIAVLGLRPGISMAIATQVTRSAFLLLFTWALAMVWK